MYPHTRSCREDGVLITHRTGLTLLEAPPRTSLWCQPRVTQFIFLIAFFPFITNAAAVQQGLSDGPPRPIMERAVQGMCTRRIKVQSFQPGQYISRSPLATVNSCQYASLGPVRAKRLMLMVPLGLFRHICRYELFQSHSAATIDA